MRPLKLRYLLKLIRLSVSSGHYLDTFHARIRKGERRIDRVEIEYVLKTGWHEKAKDRFDDVHIAWNYAIRGLTLDGKEIRVIVSFLENRMIIITVMEIE